MIGKIKQTLNMEEVETLQPYIDPLGNEYPSYNDYVNSLCLDTDLIQIKLWRGEREPQNDEERAWKKILDDMIRSEEEKK